MVLLVLVMSIILPAAAGIDEVCLGLSNAHKCSAEIEKAQLPKWKERVSREDSTLSVVLKSGKTVDLVDDDRYHYRFRSCNERAGKCVFAKGANEHLSYVVVDTNTGRRDEYRGIPGYSPDGASFTVAGSWGQGGSRLLEIRDVASDLILFELTARRLVELASLLPDCVEVGVPEASPAAGQARWLNDDTVRFNFWCYDGTAYGTSMSFVLTRMTDGWSLEEVQP